MAGVKYGCRGRPWILFYRLVQGLVSLPEVFSASRSQLLRVQGLGEKVAGEIKSFDVDSVTECELRLVDKEGIWVLTLESSEYSPLLKLTYDPPPVLYVKGKSLDSISFPLVVVETLTPSE